MCVGCVHSRYATGLSRSRRLTGHVGLSAFTATSIENGKIATQNDY